MARSRLTQVVSDPVAIGRSRIDSIEINNGLTGRQLTEKSIRSNFVQTITRRSSKSLMSRVQSDPLRYGDVRAEDLFPGSINTVHIKTASITTAKIADLAVTTAKINTLAVTTAKIDDLAVTTGKINTLAVTTAKIDDLAVTTAKINTLAVTTAKIDDLAVTTGKIVDLAVSTAKIADLAVTNGKIFSLDAGKITAGLLSVERLNITGIIIAGISWTNNSPGAGSVAWSSGTLTYKGVTYAISSGNTSNKYIYWTSAATSFSSSATLPSLTDDDFMIAINNSGTHDLYFNSPTPPVQGVATDHILDLAITNAKINDLSATKITTGTLDAGSVTIASDDGKMTLSNNIFQVKNGSDVNQLALGKYDGTNYGLAIGTNFSSPDIVINSAGISVNSHTFFNMTNNSRIIFSNPSNSDTGQIGFILGQMQLIGPSGTRGTQITNNVCFFASGSPDYGGGSNVIQIQDRSAAPSSNPSQGGILYAESGALKWRGSGGTVTTIAAA